MLHTGNKTRTRRKNAMGIKYIIAALLFTSCNVSSKVLEKYNNDNFNYVGRTVTYEDEVVAKLKAIELSYDGGELIYEATFELTNSKYNPYAINVIKIARMHPKMKDWDIEVELKY